jgi:lipoprotein-anchoring transpeptidase ErfK/SrfK
VRDRSLRVVISIADRQLWVVDGSDTLRTAAVAVGMGRLLEYGGRRWAFATPRGVRTIVAKSEAPKWRPPDWAYAEVAREHHLRLAHLSERESVTLRAGRKLVVRDTLVGLMLPDGFAALPVDEHIVFDSTLYVPPLGTANRRIDGELGNYRLDMGGGYLLHGTPRGETPRSATTHGCVRLGDDDLQWVYEFVPVGAKVYIY